MSKRGRGSREPGPLFILAIVVMSLGMWLPGLELIKSYERGGPKAVAGRLKAWGLKTP